MDDYRKYENEMLGGAAPSDVQQRIEDMNVGWRNYLTQAMGMDTNTFQVAQGTLGLQTSDSSGLFRMANGVPPYSSVAMYDASANSTRFDSYGNFLNALLPTTSSGMQKALGPKYASWVAFKQANYTKFTSVKKMFDSFAMGNLDATQTKAGHQVLKQTENDMLSKAIDAYMDPENQTHLSMTRAKAILCRLSLAPSQTPPRRSTAAHLCRLIFRPTAWTQARRARPLMAAHLGSMTSFGVVQAVLIRPLIQRQSALRFQSKAESVSMRHCRQSPKGGITVLRSRAAITPRMTTTSGIPILTQAVGTHSLMKTQVHLPVGFHSYCWSQMWTLPLRAMQVTAKAI